MRLQYLCHFGCALSATIGFSAALAAEPTATALPAHNFPTMARVEYVNDCVAKDGYRLAAMYQCGCAIDRIADALSYEDYVEASTFAKYSTLPGEGGGIFRDSDKAKQLAKRYRDLESASLQACGMPKRA
jgi:hypothetical protein